MSYHISVLKPIWSIRIKAFISGSGIEHIGETTVLKIRVNLPGGSHRTINLNRSQFMYLFGRMKHPSWNLREELTTSDGEKLSSWLIGKNVKLRIQQSSFRPYPDVEFLNLVE